MSEWPEASMLSPLKFRPIYKERIWGGTLMPEVLGRDVPAGALPIGESWELSDRDEAVSVVACGALEGVSLRELMTRYGTALLGRKARSDGRFPLLVKLIDAGDRLSLQVHPDEQVAQRIGGGAESKTEMWYIIAACRGANILAGLSPRATRLQLKDQLSSPEVEQLLQVYPSQPGDAYFIPSGTLHAIGGGNLILEIQQNSDTTYRISDWGRVDAAGRSRELHVEKGLMAIDFMNRSSPRIAGVSDEVAHNRKFSIVDRCRYFKVDDLRLVTVWHDDTSATGSFHLLSAVNKPVRIGKGALAEEQALELQAGETALIPFAYGAYSVRPLAAGETAMVKTTL